MHLGKHQAPNYETALQPTSKKRPEIKKIADKVIMLCKYNGSTNNNKVISEKFKLPVTK